MKKMTKFFALALLAGAMVSCSTEKILRRRWNGTAKRPSRVMYRRSIILDIVITLEKA